MKKLILFAVAAFTLSTTASAQDFGWGVKAGANLSSIVGQDVNKDNVKPKVDLVAGVFAEYNLSDRFAVGAELLYSGQGCATEVAGSKTTYLDYGYLILPIYAKVNIVGGLAAKAGVQAGLPLFTKGRQDGKSEIDNDLNPDFDLSIPVGLSYTLNCGLIIDARYNIGVTKLYDVVKSYNSVFALTLGWKF